MTTEQQGMTHSKEEVILVLNDHWLVLLRPFAGYIGALGLLLTIIFLSFAFADVANPVGQIGIGASLVGLVVVHHIFFLYMLRWQLSDLIVTTNRIIEFDVMPYVKNDSLIIDLQQVNKIQKSRHGFLQNIFNYGTLSLLLLGSTKEVHLRHVRCPSKLANFLEAYKNNAFAGYTVEQMRQLYHSEEKFT